MASPLEKFDHSSSEYNGRLLQATNKDGFWQHHIQKIEHFMKPSDEGFHEMLFFYNILLIYYYK